MTPRGFSSIHRSSTCSGLVLAMAILSSGAAGSAAFAQENPAAPTADNAPAVADADAGPGEILVTARRKSENILKTPISISALTAEDLAAKNTTTIQDIAQSVPGLNVQQAATSGGRADRSFTSIQLRGFVPSTSAAQTTSIFIDGAPVSVATALQALTNPERVEVIKGPQSALFGRQTFAGAINVVTKAPSEELSGSASALIGTRANYDVQGEISAPLIRDVLSFRASIRALGKHGSYDNKFVPHETLGDQTTKTGSLAIVFTPTSNLTIKAYGLATELDDGPSANGLISAYSTPAGQNLVIGQSNCIITSSTGVRNPFFCGVAPSLSPLAPSANTAKTPAINAFLNLRTGDPLGTGTVGRVLTPSQGVDGYGLVNHYRHAHLNADWAIGDSGVTLSSLTAFNRELKGELADLDNYYSATVGVGLPANAVEGFYNFPFMIEAKSRDFSQEFRASFENGGPLHGSVGGSYLFARNQSDSGSPYLRSLTYGGAAQSRTYGVFGSVSYDISSQFSLSADARYQIDKLYAFAGQAGYTDRTTNTVTAPNNLIVSAKFKNFLPRVIGQFNWDPRNMVYASYSKGVNPGQFNTAFPASPEPQVRARAVALGYQVAVKPEKITNYEIGAKGRLFGIVRYDAAAFLAIWSDQIQNQSETILKQAIVGDTGPAPVGSPLQVTASVNTGKVRVWGLEANTSIDLARGLTVDLSGAYTKTYILSASNPTVSAFYNIPAANLRGHENAFVSKWSGTSAVSYTHPITDKLDAFGRADFTYKSGGWADIANVVRAPNLNQVNLRAGVRNRTFSIEGFVTNLFNNKAYYNVSSQTLLIQGVTAGAYGALIAQLRDLRTFGARASFNF